MRKAVLLSLVAAFGCLGFSYYERTRAELDLRKRVGELLANVHCNAQGLNQSQMRELEDLLLGHDFTFKPQSVRLSTAPTNNRPLDQICNQSKFAEHVLFYSYERPTVLLPFQTELHEARAEKLVEIPGTAPRLFGTESSDNSHQSSMIRQQQIHDQAQQRHTQQFQAQMAKVARQSRNNPPRRPTPTCPTRQTSRRSMPI